MIVIVIVIVIVIELVIEFVHVTRQTCTCTITSTSTSTGWSPSSMGSTPSEDAHYFDNRTGLKDSAMRSASSRDNPVP